MDEQLETCNVITWVTWFIHLNSIYRAQRSILRIMSLLVEGVNRNSGETSHQSCQTKETIDRLRELVDRYKTHSKVSRQMHYYLSIDVGGNFTSIISVDKCIPIDRQMQVKSQTCILLVDRSYEVSRLIKAKLQKIKNYHYVS